ncbi:hypothetical protein [Gephyromycinifex aptenodytis]|uniref:hypothetical protein n=1 Tax=Gephyromycinifex aptenodytis TaxID=2716227 RepID=UPI001447CBE0|nr:hypothetical protein [Gephyromycinifex aptenodytis]
MKSLSFGSTSTLTLDRLRLAEARIRSAAQRASGTDLSVLSGSEPNARRDFYVMR